MKAIKTNRIDDIGSERWDCVFLKRTSKLAVFADKAAADTFIRANPTLRQLKASRKVRIVPAPSHARPGNYF